MFDGCGPELASTGESPVDAGDAATDHAQVRWARHVDAELTALERAWDELLAAGIDPADPIAADLVVGAWIEAEEQFSGPAGHGAAADEMPAGHLGWIAAHARLLDDVPGDGPADLSSMVPGARLADVLATETFDQLTTSRLADSVAAWEKVIAWAQAQQAAAAAELTRRPEMQADNAEGRSSLHPVAVTAGDICTVWPWTKPQAQRLVSWSVQLIDSFPAVHHALAEGRLDARRARILTDALADHDPQVARLVEAAVLPYVHLWTSVKVSYVVKRLLAEIAPETAKERRRNARKKRAVWIEPAADGMAWLYAYLPAEDAEALMATLTAAAEGSRLNDEQTRTSDHLAGDAETGASAAEAPAADAAAPADAATDAATGTAPPPSDADADVPADVDAAPADAPDPAGPADVDAAPADAPDPADPADASADPPDAASPAPRSLDQRRADALAALAWSSLYTGHLGGDGCARCGSPAGAPLASAHGRPVTVNVTVSLSTLIGLDEVPGELEGYGAIDADLARRLAAAGVWRWVGTDPVGGWALDYGRTRYKPPRDLVDFVILRDRECIMPGCHRSAYRCEIDHRVPFPQGPTSACNCSALCKPCHLQKHHAGWRLERVASGTQRWTSPSGHQQTVSPPRMAGAAATHPSRNTGPPEPPPF
ncbi:HNH endonuclease signature motif containing protein [Phytoactinopolyspora mesophila]|nr:HNH endonuclease signature motif containing protein [Phytoactinopolyspora mesophila]